MHACWLLSGLDLIYSQFALAEHIFFAIIYPATNYIIDAAME
jgi:hypothetical protein